MITLTPASPSAKLPPSFDHMVGVYSMTSNRVSHILVALDWESFSIRDKEVSAPPIYYSISPSNEVHVWPMEGETVVKILWAPAPQELSPKDLPQAITVIGNLLKIIEEAKWAIIATDKTGDVVRDLSAAPESSGWEDLLQTLRKEEQESYNAQRRGGGTALNQGNS